MLQHICPTGWHQIFLVAAGFLTAILHVYAQFWQRSFYGEKYDERCEQDRRFSNNIAGLWLFVGELFALIAFGLTGLHWLLVADNAVQCSLAACLIGRMQQLAAGFLMGAFVIALIAVIEQICAAGRTLKAKGMPDRIAYTYSKKIDLFTAVRSALYTILVFCLLPAIIVPLLSWWIWLVLCFLSLLIPALILLCAYKQIRR